MEYFSNWVYEIKPVDVCMKYVIQVKANIMWLENKIGCESKLNFEGLHWDKTGSQHYYFRAEQHYTLVDTDIGSGRLH